MLSIADCRKKLPDNGKNLTDQEVEERRNRLYRWAKTLADVTVERKLEELGIKA